MNASFSSALESESHEGERRSEREREREREEGRTIKFRLSEDFGDASFGRGLSRGESGVWMSSGTGRRRGGSASGSGNGGARFGGRRGSGVAMSMTVGGEEKAMHVQSLDALDASVMLASLHSGGGSGGGGGGGGGGGDGSGNKTRRARMKRIATGSHLVSAAPGSHDPAARGRVVAEELLALLPRQVPFVRNGPRSPCYTRSPRPLDIGKIQRQRWASLRYLKQLAREEKLKQYRNMTLRKIRDAQSAEGNSTTDGGSTWGGGMFPTSGFGMSETLHLPDDMSMAERKRAIAKHAEAKNRRLLASLAKRTDSAQARKDAVLEERKKRIARHSARVQAAKARQERAAAALEEKQWAEREAVTQKFKTKLLQMEKKRVDQYNLRQQLKLNGLEFEHAREEIHRMIRENPDFTLEEIDRVIDDLNVRSARVLAATTNLPVPPVEPITIDEGVPTGDKSSLTRREHMVSQILRRERSTVPADPGSALMGSQNARGLRAALLRSRVGKAVAAAASSTAPPATVGSSGGGGGGGGGGADMVPRPPPGPPPSGGGGGGGGRGGRRPSSGRRR